MAVLTASLKPDTTILRDGVLLVSDLVVSSNIVLAGLEDVLCRLEHFLMCVALVACGRYDQVEPGLR